MNYRTIDMKSYPRRAHFDYFRSLQNPMLGVTVDVDVTALRDFCKAEGCSLYLAFMRCAARAANAVPQLRQRIRDGGIVEYDACGTSHVELRSDGTYGYCTLYHDRPFREYLEYARTERLRCREAASIEEDEDVEALYFITSLPWLHYTQLIQPTAGGDESNPRISWGRYEADHRGRLMLRGRCWPTTRWWTACSLPSSTKISTGRSLSWQWELTAFRRCDKLLITGCCKWRCGVHPCNTTLPVGAIS